MKRLLAIVGAAAAFAVAAPASASAAYPPCDTAWSALNGGLGSDNDMANAYGGLSRTRKSCGHSGGNTYTYTNVAVKLSSVTTRCDTWRSYYASTGTLYDGLVASSYDVCL